MRLIIYTGKGGVGKTSVAAATALKCARKGYRTLIMSTDAAHSVSDSMETELCGQPTRVEENLDAIEIDMLYELETRWSEIQKYISDFLVSQGLDGITSKEMSVIPGMELMSALFYLDDFHKKGTYDVIVMDTAPTGETIKLLSFPESSEWYSDKLYRIIHNLIKVARMTIGKVMSTPLPSEELLKDLEMLIGRMKNVQKILEDPEITSIRLVVNPEKMVINETKRAYTYLCLYGLTVECLVINRLLPDGNDDYFAQKRIEQEKYMKIIQESFDPLKMLKAQQLPVELVGMKSLEYLGDMLFQDEDPTSRFTTERPIEIYSENGKDIIALRLPFMPKEKVQLYKSSDSLVVEAGQYRRSMSLPFTFIQKEPEKAEFTDGMLRIMFPGDDVSGERKPAE
ncbi:ArsA family ATPase [Candidatus Methanomassiliicoccus intestinalis]|uniref:Putative arsenical pump-driving ATPase n=1 Tax=Methanomassiliicoccus intestinalis (strain Issoire-Mx1) TaxID=1295009 RepID=R9T8R0_METII|nr:ArsA family ATPase [Candidatus Methanomassiliicoccus intestinalis]AGN25738.1 Arsenical pump-driving ATPase [Candidatus Methanomassiliicoccus intestinalis Issoire-Mx1]